jgi:hypothetical protein
VSIFVLFVACLTAGVSVAGASSKTPANRPTHVSAGHAIPHVSSAAGTYEWFVNGTDDGQIVLNGDGTWGAKSACDTGSWLTQKSTIALSDLTCGGDATGETFMATVGKHGLSSAKKPGSFRWPAFAYSGGWYAIKLS